MNDLDEHFFGVCSQPPLDTENPRRFLYALCFKAMEVEKARWTILGGFRKTKNRGEIAEKRIREEAMELPIIDFFDSL